MKTKILIFLTAIILMTGCSSNIEYDNQKDCSKPKLLLSKDDSNIYTYCIDKVNVENTELKKYIEDDEDAISKIVDSLKLKDTLLDGGTKIYKGDITLIKCNTLDGNKDIYIGNKYMKFKNNFCKNNNYTFIKTYTVKDISKYNGIQYENGVPVAYGNSYQVTLNEYNGKTKTIIINNLWDITLKKNTTYEFEFRLYDSATDIKDEIEYIFKNSDIIEIKKTNKTGNNQIQEPVNKEIK